MTGPAKGPSRRVPLNWIKSGKASDHTPKSTSHKGLTSLLSSKFMSSLVIARVVVRKPSDCDYNSNSGHITYWSFIHRYGLTPWLQNHRPARKKTFQVLVLRSFSLPYKVNVSHPIKLWAIKLLSKKMLLWTNVYWRVN